MEELKPFTKKPENKKTALSIDNATFAWDKVSLVSYSVTDPILFSLQQVRNTLHDFLLALNLFRL